MDESTFHFEELKCFSFFFSFEKKKQNEYEIYLLCFDIKINMTIKSVQITWTNVEQNRKEKRSWTKSEKQHTHVKVGK